MSDQTEADALKAILAEDYSALTKVGYTCDGFETVADVRGGKHRWYQCWHPVIRGPSGQHYQWEHQVGVSESQESFGPAELGGIGVRREIELTLVHPVEERVVVTKWVADA